MKLIYTTLIMLYCLYSQSQSVELSGGIFSNKFYEWNSSQHNDYGVYSSELSGYFGLGIRQIKLDDARIGITVQYEKYGGNIMAYSGGMGGGSSTEAEISKSLLSFCFYFFDGRIFDGFNLSFGFVYSTLLDENFSGTYNLFSNFSSEFSKREDLQEKYTRFNSKSYLGFQGSYSYDINLTSDIILSPHYSYYLGIGNELRVSEFQRIFQSMRHYLGLSIKRKI